MGSYTSRHRHISLEIGQPSPSPAIRFKDRCAGPAEASSSANFVVRYCRTHRRVWKICNIRLSALRRSGAVIQNRLSAYRLTARSQRCGLSARSAKSNPEEKISPFRSVFLSLVGACRRSRLLMSHGRGCAHGSRLVRNASYPPYATPAARRFPNPSDGTRGCP